MSVAEVESANHRQSERIAHPRNAQKDGSHDPVSTLSNSNSNGASMALDDHSPDNGASSHHHRRYDTKPPSDTASPPDEALYPNASLSYPTKYPFQSSIDTPEYPMRTHRGHAAQAPPAPTVTANPPTTSSSPVKNLPPVTTTNHDATTDDPLAGKPLSIVTTPVSPPPSPPSGFPANGTIKSAASTASGDATPRPMGTAEIKEPSSAGIPSNTGSVTSTGTARGGSLASLLHTDNRDVTEGDSNSKRDMHGTPPSPDSLPQVGHSRNPSMADSSTTAKESPMKENRDDEEEEAMDVDHPTITSSSNRSGSPSPSRIASENGITNAHSLPLPTHPARRLASRSPQPQPPSNPHSISGVLAHSQPRSQPSPSTSSVVHPPYPHPSHVSPQSQPPRHHSNINTTTHPHSATTSSTHASATASSRSQTDRLPLPLPYPQATQTPTPESPPSNRASHVHSHGGAADDRDRHIEVLIRDRDDMLRRQKHIEERYIQQIQELQRRDGDYRAAEVRHLAWVNAVSDWIREGQRLLGEASVNTVNGYTSSNASRNAGPGGVPLSSAIVGSSRDYDRSLERDRTLSVVSPYSPVMHARSNSSYGHGSEHQRYPSQGSATPNHSDPSRRNANSTRAAAPTAYNSLRRARRPSSDDLAAQAGAKRIKTDNGEYIRVSPESGTPVSYSREHQDPRLLPHGGMATPTDLRRGPPAFSREGHSGMFTPTELRRDPPAFGREGTVHSGTGGTSDKRGSGSLGSGTERGRDSPSDRKTAGRDDDEDEFPSPRRAFATPTTATGPSAAGNGHVAVGRGPSSIDAHIGPTAVGEDADADGSPDPAVGAGLGAHKELMELAEDDSEAMSARAGLKRTRDGMRNGSRSSMNSQDIDEMLAEVVGDEDDPSIARYGTDVSMKSTTKQRHRGGSTTLTRNPGGSISAFPIHIGPHSDVSPGLTRTYTKSSQYMGMQSPSPGLGPSNSRGYVFRNMDIAEMEAQSQARSPEDSTQRQSFSGSLPTTVAGSPPGPTGPMTMQFLPPQSGPPMPKKIYHNKGTGQVIGSHAGLTSSMSGPLDPNSATPRSVPPAGFMTVDGQMKRTCKQCGQPGRYKDNKCVEKWGPGPQGPGTVCDRCRKKMKRVEKRATQDSTMMAAAAGHPHQYPLAPAPAGSFPQIPLQGSQRFDESQESGYSQATDDGRASLSRAGSQNYSMHQSQLTRRGSYVPDPALRREPSHPYHSAQNPSRESMPPPSSFTAAHASPTSSRGDARQSTVADAASGNRDDDVDADGDAEMDELMDEELGAAADAAAAGVHRNRLTGESP